MLRALLIAALAWALPAIAVAQTLTPSQPTFFTPAPALIQPFSSAQVTMPASGTTACYIYFAPYTGGCLTGVQASPNTSSGTVSGLTWTATANATAAGTMSIELISWTVAGFSGTPVDTNYGCTITMVASNVQCICTPANTANCTHAGTTSAPIVAGKLYAWKFTAGTTANWNTLSTQVAWTLAAPNGGQVGQLAGGSGNASMGVGVQTSFISTTTTGLINSTDALSAAFEPNLGITITEFSTWTGNISDTSPGHSWTLFKNGSATAMTCNTVGVKTCSATGSVHIAPFDTYSIQVVGITSSVNILPAVAISFVPDIPGESPVFAQAGSGTTASAFYNLEGIFSQAAQVTEATVQGVTPAFPNSYTLSNLLFFQSGANAAGKSRTGTLRTSATFPATPSASPLACSTPANTGTGTVGNGGLTGIICQSGASVSMVPSSYADWGMVASASIATAVVRYSAIAVIK